MRSCCGSRARRGLPSSLRQVVLNQLFGAQRCDGSAWGYYVQMQGKKPYSSTLDGHCCLSSGPRGVALIPTFALSTDADGVVVNLYDAGTAQLKLRDGTPVTLTTETQYPGDEQIRIAVEPAETKSFALKLRIPAWCQQPRSKSTAGKCTAHAERRWLRRHPARNGRTATRSSCGSKLEPRVIVGDHKNQGKVAVLYGPLVLAADEALLGNAQSKAKTVPRSRPGDGPDSTQCHRRGQSATGTAQGQAGSRAGRIPDLARRASLPHPRRHPQTAACDSRSARHCPSGWFRSPMRVPRERAIRSGCRCPANFTAAICFWTARQAIRARTISDGSMTDEDFETFVTTSDGKLADEDWFAVELNEPVMVKRVLFAHGKTLPNGGWFDSTAGKPRIQVKRTKDGAWETVAEISDYPATTAKNSAEMEGGEHVVCKLASPIKAWAVRVMGKPACGDNPNRPVHPAPSCRRSVSERAAPKRRLSSRQRAGGNTGVTLPFCSRAASGGRNHMVRRV